MRTKLHYLLPILLLLVGSLFAQVDPGTANLIHLWTFEDGTANDLIGDADGELLGNNIYIDNGDLVTVPNGDGVADSWVELPGWAIDIGGTCDEVAIAVWFTPDTANNYWNSLWFFGDDGQGAGMGSDGMGFQPRREDTKARFWFTTGNPSAPYNNEDGVDDVGNNYNNDTLYHVVCQVNSLGDQGEIMMYHDAVLIGTTTLTADATAGKDNCIYNISPNFARFCHSCYSGDTPWLGRLHEVAMFNKALSDEEVLYLFEHQDWSANLSEVENEAGALPSEYSLAQNYPNPFNPTTQISYTLKKSEQVKLVVCDVLGREIATLVDGFQDQGMYNITFNAKDLTSGIYYYQLRTSTGILTKKMILMK
jgi:hypothetical protein